MEPGAIIGVIKHFQNVEKEESKPRHLWGNIVLEQGMGEKNQGPFDDNQLEKLGPEESLTRDRFDL